MCLCVSVCAWGRACVNAALRQRMLLTCCGLTVVPVGFITFCCQSRGRNNTSPTRSAEAITIQRSTSFSSLAKLFSQTNLVLNNRETSPPHISPYAWSSKPLISTVSCESRQAAWRMNNGCGLLWELKRCLFFPVILEKMAPKVNTGVTLRTT